MPEDRRFPYRAAEACNHAWLPLVAAATLPNQPQRCVLTDYFNNYNFRKLNNTLPDDGNWTEICRICFVVNFNIILKQLYCASVGKKKDFDIINMQGTNVKIIMTLFITHFYSSSYYISCYVFRPNIILNALFVNALNAYPSLDVRDQVSHP